MSSRRARARARAELLGALFFAGVLFVLARRRGGRRPVGCSSPSSERDEEAPGAGG